LAVLVTGAASGIGRATAERCWQDGATVAALDLDLRSLGETMQRLEALDAGRYIALEADVADPIQVRSALADLARSLDALYGVVNVAGIGGYTGDVAETTLEQWGRSLAVNLSGAFHVCREALALLRAGGRGRIVNVSSQYGLLGGAGSPAYCAAKAGMIGLTKAMAVDHADEGILVNCVCPGPIDTAMLAASGRSGERSKRESRRTATRLLLGRPGRPDDVAGVIAFLLGPDARNMTGAVVAVDGGWSAS
jgi:NAD(P)-dependent dehydrogenase (short-subunit alcohol dehydrogenase family)